MEKKINDKFIALFGAKPDLTLSSPGRINLIGEHTDYNGGWVLPAAIDKKITFAIGRRTDGLCQVHSVDFDDTETVSLSHVKLTPKSWVNYLMGVVEQFQNEKMLPYGFNLVFGGDVPLGAGLSSSAAVEAGLAIGLNQLYDLGKERMALVRLAQRAENQFVGVKCGIMDMFASAMGKAGSVIRLDCRSLEYSYFPFDFSDVKIVLCDTAVKHSLGDGEYNIRREQCEIGVAILQKYDPSVKMLRDVSFALLEKYKDELPPIVYQRCRYMVGEIARVEAACEDLNRHDLVAFGKKMNETHDGLSKDYGVSCDELDFLAEKAQQTEGVWGSRMMGGGFGGCTINLVKTEAIPAFIEKMTAAYKEAYNIDLKTYTVMISDGTTIY